MSNDSDHGDENDSKIGDAEDGRRPPSHRFFKVEECHEVDEEYGVSHWVVARDMTHACEILGAADLTDAKRLEIIELDRTQAAMLQVHDVDDGERYSLAEAPMGALYSEEF